MTKVDIAALLAVVAALISGVGDVIRQRSAQEITNEQVGHFELFRLSLRDIRWWWGGLAAAASFALQAVALVLGSVVLVQALQVTALLFALPTNARLTGHPVRRREWLWALLLAGAVAVFVIVGDPAAGYQRGSLAAWLIVAVVFGPALALCVLGARVCSGPVAAVLLAVVSASSWALFAVLTKGVVEVFRDGPGAVMRAPELYAWIFAALVGTVFQQSAFRASTLTASLPAMTVAEPVVASVLGVTVLGETLDTPGPQMFILVAAVVAVVIATTALARGEAATMVADGDGRPAFPDPDVAALPAHAVAPSAATVAEV
ncbi:MAG: DMT family transporter [Mycobacterium sp.]|uniref:DMT family transporter n=1 Tax=Mycobacterium sp. TaxID=1785 RepID=UPI003C462F8C